MKFISKNSNLTIVLEPGMSANMLAGVAGKAGVYVKFQDGVVEVKDETMIRKMHQHPGFNSDFIAVDDNGEDPFASQREEMEPAHSISEIKYGHVEGKKLSPNRKVKLDPQIKKLVDEMAMEQIKKILPAMVEEGIKRVLDIGAAKALKEQSKKDKTEE